MKSLLLILSLIFPISISAQLIEENILLNSGMKYETIPDKWYELRTELLDSTNLEDHDIFYPHALTVNKSNELAVMAWDDRVIYVFNEGKLSAPKKLRSRKGRGPREYDLPFDMYLSENELWISDINLRKIDAWDINKNEIVRSHSFENVFVKPDQIAVCRNKILNTNELFVLSTQYGYGDSKKEGILHKYHLKNENLVHKETFQKLTDQDERYGYVITGDINCSDNGDLFYSGDFTGTIRKYNTNGEILYFRGANNFIVEEPLFFKKDEDMTIYNPDAPRINGDVFMINDEVFIGRSRSIDRYIYGIDVYNPKSGNYLYSFKFPIPAKEYAITENRLFIVEYKGDNGFDLKVFDYVIIKD
ncbi:hypothetical protein AB2B38_012005 [Balneola sp. MJW-20]|uniref:hypothetical protein n=1 Tax=Gracilimonas aurantiaca TaxID=3234185 RepID=UPI003909BC49